MEKWIKLISLNRGYLYRGTVFRFPAQYPFEPIVDWLLVTEGGEYKFFCASGYKAGYIETCLPGEAHSDQVSGISSKWLIQNWATWVYPECKVEDVYILENYFAPTKLPAPCSPEEFDSNNDEITPSTTKGRDKSGYRDLKVED